VSAKPTPYGCEKHRRALKGRRSGTIRNEGGREKHGKYPHESAVSPCVQHEASVTADYRHLAARPLRLEARPETPFVARAARKLHMCDLT
jgi:hypothetical protein